MKKFFEEFKKFITRGNVVDMAVGVIIGSSFTAIVNALSNNVLKPLINWVLAVIFHAEDLSEVFTMLKPGYDEAGALDLAKSIYIDWGALINAIINFFLIAIVLFSIVKIINRVRDNQKEFAKDIKRATPTKEDRKVLKSRGIKLSDKHAVAAYLAEKYAAEEAKVKAEEQKKRDEEERKKREKEEAAPTDRLLMEIRDLLTPKK